MAGFLDALRAFFNPAPGFEPDAIRGLTFEQLFNTGSDLDWVGNTARERIDVESALRIIAVQAAVRLLVNDIGSLPVDAYRSGEQGKKELRKPPFVIEPNPGNPNATWEDHVKQTVYGVITDGNAFTYCIPSVMRPEAIIALDPKDVEIVGGKGFAPVTYRVASLSAELTGADIVHVPWIVPPGKHRGVDPITAAAEGLGIGRAADKFVGSYFGNGAFTTGWLEFPPGTDPTDEQIKQMLDGINRKHRGAAKAHALGALTAGASLKQNQYNNRDAQLLELRDSIVEDVARLFGIPPHMLGSQKPGAVGYASVEQRSIDYVTHAVLPIVKRLEVGYSRMLRGSQTYLKFNVAGLLRGDAQARAAFYDSMLQNKVIRRDEVRALEDLPFDADAVGYLETPNNNAPDPAPAPDPEPSRSLVVNVPEQRSTPTTVEAHIHNHLAAPEVRTDVHVPEQPAPVINVAAPDVIVPPAEVRVDVPQQAPPLVTVNTPDTLRIASMPARITERRVTKRENGQIVETQDIEADL